jgi:hypothetical protein
MQWNRRGRKYPTTQAGGALAWEDVGTTDIRLIFTVAMQHGTNAGEVRLLFCIHKIILFNLA